jgi:hypothetical protein
MKPNNQLANPTGKFAYEDREIDYSAAKAIEYSGEEVQLQVYVPIQEYLSPGTYHAFVFIDGQMIGSGSVELKK